MRKLLVFLMLISLLVLACTPNSKPGDPTVPTNPSNPPSAPHNPDPGTNGEEEPPERSLAQAQIIWQRDSLPSTFQDIQVGNTLLYLSADIISGQNLVDGATLWQRDLVQDGFRLCDILLYEAPPLLRKDTLSYPLSKGGKIYIEQLDILTGSVHWCLEIGREGEVSFQWEEELLKVVSGPYPDEECAYYELSSGKPIPCLDGNTAYWYKGAYFTFSQAKPYTVAKYSSGCGQLWNAAIDAKMSYPYLAEMWSEGDVLLLNFADFNGIDVQYLTLALNDLSGEVIWSKPGFRAGIWNDDVIIIAGGKTTLVEIASGNEIRILADEDGVETNSFFWDGALYITTRSRFRKIDLDSGKEKWRQDMPGLIDLYYGVNSQDELRETDILWSLLERTTEPEDYLDEQLLAIDPLTGSIIASYPFTVPFGGPESWPIKLTKDPGENTYVVLEMNAHRPLPERSVLLIDAQTGRKLWEYQYPDDYNEVNVFFSESNNLVVVLRDFSQEVEVLYLAKQTGEKVHHFRAKGYPSLMVGDRILMDISSNQTSMIAPPE